MDERQLLLERRAPDVLADDRREVGLPVTTPLGKSVCASVIADCIGAQPALGLEVGDDPGGLRWRPAHADEVGERLLAPSHRWSPRAATTSLSTACASARMAEST